MLSGDVSFHKGLSEYNTFVWLYIDTYDTGLANVMKSFYKQA